MRLAAACHKEAAQYLGSKLDGIDGKRRSKTQKHYKSPPSPDSEQFKVPITLAQQQNHHDILLASSSLLPRNSPDADNLSVSGTSRLAADHAHSLWRH